MKTKIEVVCYDVNGTLMDDTAKFLNAINGIFTEFGKPTMDPEVLRAIFGQPWTKIYRDSGITAEIVSDDELYKIYNRLYLAGPEPKAFEDVKATLEWLKSSGIMLTIVSTQENEVTSSLLKANGLSQFFGYMRGKVPNKAKALVRMATDKGVKPCNCAYVGDQEGDGKHAKEAGCIFIGFAGGLHTADRLRKAGADFIIEKHSEIKGLPIFG